MYNFCHNNYIQFGWDDNLYGDRQHDDQFFWIKYGRCERDYLDFRSECINAAKLIYDSTEKKIIIHLSGGMDSEIVCRSFIEAGLPFEVYIWVYDGEINKHDIEYAFKLCKEYNVKYRIQKFSLIEFMLNNKHKDCRYHIPLWSINMKKYMIKKTNGYQLFGDGHLNLMYDPLSKSLPFKNKYLFPMPLYAKNYKPSKDIKDEIYSVFNEQKHAMYYSFADYHNREASDFFTYTPELVMSYLNDKYVKDWLTYYDLKDIPEDKKYPMLDGSPRYPIWASKKKFLNSIRASSVSNFKCHIQYRHWPELEFRPKYTGADCFEGNLMVRHLSMLTKKYPYDSPGNEMVFIPSEEFLKGMRYE